MTSTGTINVEWNSDHGVDASASLSLRQVKVTFETHLWAEKVVAALTTVVRTGTSLFSLKKFQVSGGSPRPCTGTWLHTTPGVPTTAWGTSQVVQSLPYPPGPKICKRSKAVSRLLPSTGVTTETVCLPFSGKIKFPGVKSARQTPPPSLLGTEYFSASPIRPCPFTRSRQCSPK